MHSLQQQWTHHAFLVVAMDTFLQQACKKLMPNENKKTKKTKP
jgi:hypothetical protein